MDTHPLTSRATRTTEGRQREGTAQTAADVSPRAAAAVAGLGLLVMAVLAGTAFTALQGLVVSGDAAQTARNIADNELLFRTIIGCFLIVAVLDVVVAWALFVLLRPAGRSIALLAAWFRVVYAAVFATALSGLFAAMRLSTDANSLEAFSAGQLNAQVVMSLDAFNDGWDAALAIFGLHLLVLGYLVWRSGSGFVTRALGVLVAIAGFGYLFDSVAAVLSSGFSIELAMFTFMGEVLLIPWLLWKVVRRRGAA